MLSPLREPAKTPLPTVPTVEVWRTMTPEARLRLQVEINTALSESVDVMSEGQPHRRTKARTIDALGLHFRTIGRTVYLAEELAVLYPGQKPFSPDVLAVLDVEQPEEDERLAWVVADEGKGPDLVLEVLHRGSRQKDLVDNVVRYAELGIAEYFVYDRAHQRIHGYRLVGRATSASCRSSDTTDPACWAWTWRSSATICGSCPARPRCPSKTA